MASLFFYYNAGLVSIFKNKSLKLNDYVVAE